MAGSKTTSIVKDDEVLILSGALRRSQLGLKK